MTRDRANFQEHNTEAKISLWTEAMVGAEVLLLHTTPVYWGYGVPHGDGSGVVLIPGFLGTDLYLMTLHNWLSRIGYRSFFSGIGLNAECPNLLIQRRLNETIAKALQETGRKIHLVGHSLGGVIARSVAGQRPEEIASVTTLGSPFRGAVVHRSVMRAAEAVRAKIMREHRANVLPGCYTGRCTCEFLGTLRQKWPAPVQETAIYTRGDGVVDWRYCMSKNSDANFEVSGTHIGLVFNPSVYYIISDRLAGAQTPK